MINLKIYSENRNLFYKIVLLLFLVGSTSVFGQDPYIKTTSGIGQYGYLEKDATTIMLLNSNSQSNISQLFGRTFLNSTNILTYGAAVNVCGATTNVDQTTSNYFFGANAIPGFIAYTSVHVDYCGGSNSYGGNPNQIGYLERQHYIFDISDRPSDLSSSIIQSPSSTNNVVMSIKIDFGSVSSRILQRFWIQNTGTLAESTEIANDGFVLYYEPATGSETFNGTESTATIFGNYNGNPTNNNIYGHDGLNIAIPAGGLRVYVVLNKFASCIASSKTAQVSLINDGLDFSPVMDFAYGRARVGQTPAAPTAITLPTSQVVSGALNGTYYIPSTCFPTVASAVTYLNANGVAGPVIFNVFAGHTETAPSGGFNLTATGTVANTIVFQKFGVGTNPTLTAFTPQTSGNLNDGIFKIVGGDYITLNGFTMIENPANMTTTTASNNMTEFGVALFYATTINGAQNNTIQNCSISLNRTYLNTFGIYSTSRTTAIAISVAADATSTAGSNSNNKIYSNAISNVNYGIVFIGTSTVVAFDSGNDIGGTSTATGNIITNWGGGAAPSGYVNLTGNNYAIFSNRQINDNISYNSITSATLTSSVTTGGILKNYTVSQPTGTITTNINNNTITITNNPSVATSIGIFGINTQGMTTLLSTATININNNTIQNCVLGGSTSTTNSLNAINNLSLPGILNINGNSIINNAITATSSTTGILRGISNSGAAETVNINNNIIRSLASTSNAPLAEVQGISNFGIVVTALNITNNQLGNATSGFFSSSIASSGTIFGISNSFGATTCALTIQSNDIRGITYAVPSSATQNYIINSAATLSQNISSNTFTNLNVNTSGVVTFISNSVTAPVSGFKTINSNSIVTGFTKSRAGGSVYLYDDLGLSTSTTAHQNNNNNFSNISVTGATVIFGWNNQDGTGSTPTKTITGNTFSNWTCGSGEVTAMNIDFGTNNINSNTVSSISGTAGIYGIYTGEFTTAATTVNNNTISTLSSTGTTTDVIAIQSLGGATQTITNNQISSLTSATDIGFLIGIYTTTGTTATTITGNTIDGMTNTVVGADAYTTGIFVDGIYSANVSSNIIRNFSTINSSTGDITAIYMASLATNHVVNLNTIYNLNALGTASGNFIIYAIYTSASTGGNIGRNTIYGLTNSATGAFPFITGIWPNGGNWTVSNNMISLTNGSNTNGMQCTAVYDTGATGTRNYFYNSIHIGGSSSSSQNSVALQYNSGTGTANVFNNILNMTRTGSGKNYALANLTAGLANMNCNYNVLNATNPATVVATVGIVDNTFTQWQTTGKDASSFTNVTVPFTNTAIADLHLVPTSCTNIESGGTPVAITIDYDNEARHATKPDIGADEFSTYTSTWDGIAWSTWNGMSFSAAVPTGNTHLVFAGNYTSVANLEGCSCSVTSGNVVFGNAVINNNHTLSLLKELIVAAAPGATLTFENNASLVQTNNVTNTGNITFKRKTTPYERYDYVYWSTPVADLRNLSSIFSGWRTDYSFTFNTQNFSDIVTFATGLAPADGFDDNSDAWTYAGSSATMTKGKGYAVMAPTSVTFSPQALPTTVSFLGVANNGNVPVRIYESANAASTIDDFNFIGNPYPSSIWANKFITDNGVKTSGTLYFWTHVADVSVSNPGPYASNFVTADYAYYNLSGGTQSGTGSTIPTGYVAAGQGFFIEAQANNVDVFFNNSMRSKTYLNNDFFRTSNTSSERNRLWLNLQNLDGLFSQLLVGYFEETTTGFDWAYDGRVNLSNTQLSFYSLEQDEKYKIQARPEFLDTDIVPLGYFSIANGQFTISLGQREGVFDTTQNVYLEDRAMNIIHDLNQSPYTFTTSYGRYEDRFILRYIDTSLANPDFETLNSSVIVATNQGEMTIKSYVENMQDVTVFDILGRQLFEAKNINNKDFVASNISLSQQTLIVKIKLENGTVVTRKVIL